MQDQGIAGRGEAREGWETPPRREARATRLAPEEETEIIEETKICCHAALSKFPLRLEPGSYL